MKLFSSILFLFLTGATFGQNDDAPKIFLEGHYQGVNIYIQNPFAEDGNSFCVDSLKVNGQLFNAEHNTSAFEVDLSRLNLTVGDPISISVYHQPTCLPRVLYQAPPRQNVEFINIEIVD